MVRKKNLFGRRFGALQRRISDLEFQKTMLKNLDDTPPEHIKLINAYESMHDSRVRAIARIKAEILTLEARVGRVGTVSATMTVSP